MEQSKYSDLFLEKLFCVSGFYEVWINFEEIRKLDLNKHKGENV